MRGLRAALTALLLVLGLAIFAAACGGDDEGGDSGGSPAKKDDVDLTQGQDVTIAMVTHDPRYARHADRSIHLFDGRIVEENVAETI